jgi:myo-inositol-1(or 4)-monophosphatase
MEVDYQKIIDFMIVSGKRLVERAGNIEDIGITKKDLTEEDLAIERGFKKIIEMFDEEHVLYAEEENDFYKNAENIWVIDPISGTHNFIKGDPHYSIVISHLVNRKTVFAAVYDPSVDELYTAFTEKGAFLNGKQIKNKRSDFRKIIVRIAKKYNTKEGIELKNKIKNYFKDYEIEDNPYSMAVNYCWVANGIHDGIISYTKDSFPEFAGSFIIRESGGKFSNINGESEISPSDKLFIGGNEKAYEKIISFARENRDIFNY